MDVTGIGEIADFAKSVVDRIWPDKTQVEQNKFNEFITQLNAKIGLTQSQLQIDLAAEQGKSMVQHFRDGAGWVCVFGFAWGYVLMPMLNWVCAAFGHPVTFPILNVAPMNDLLMGLLGLGGMHVYQQVKGS